MMSALLQKPLAVLLFGAVMLMEPSCLRDSYQVKLAGTVTLESQWVEFRPKLALRADKTFAWVLLDLAAPLQDDAYGEGKGPLKGKGILMPDGEVINPDVEVIDQYGNTFQLVYSGAKGGPIYGCPYPNKLPPDREYKSVRIRSPRPIKCKAIYWYCESSKDWK